MYVTYESAHTAQVHFILCVELKLQLQSDSCNQTEAADISRWPVPTLKQDEYIKGIEMPSYERTHWKSHNSDGCYCSIVDVVLLTEELSLSA